MSSGRLIGSLLGGAALAVAAAPAEAAEPAPSTDPASAEAKIEQLARQVEELKAQIDAMKGLLVKSTPTWKGAPEFADKDGGFSFKPKGFMQFDAGYVGFPNGDEQRGTLGGLNFANLGWNVRARRLVFGAEGGLPGGFKYKAEFNFAQGSVDYEDITLSYDFKKSPLTLTVGNMYPFSSLETVTSSRLGAMLERASFTDAFNYNRRLGLALSLADKKADRYTLAAGIFSTPINDASFQRTGWEVGARGTYSPPLAKGLLHLGASAHHRVNVQEALAQQYRSRPLTQITSERFVDTGNLASRGDTSIGLELGGVWKRFHFASEVQKLWVNHAYNVAEIAAQNANPETNDFIPAGAVALDGNPSFWGGYFEAGYYFTGETRGYKGGRWDRTKVLHPFDKDGWGALQLNGRVDYVDLTDRVSDSSNSVAAPFYVNGGKQLGLQASLIWNPIDYIRFVAQYGHVAVTGGPRAAAVDPASTKPVNKRGFDVDTAAVRAQVEF